MFYYAYITWLGFFRPNLFLPNLRFKLVKSGKNQNAGIMGWYEEFLFTAAVVYYLKRASYQSSSVIIFTKKATYFC